MLLNSGKNIQLSEIIRENNAGCPSTPQINMLSRSMNIPLRIPTIACSLKELHREFGNFVLMLMKMVAPSPKMNPGRGNSHNLTNLLETMDRESSDLPNITFPKISTLSAINSTMKKLTLNSTSNVLLEFYL